VGGFFVGIASATISFLHAKQRQKPNMSSFRVQISRRASAEHAQAIEVFYLPSYSPELNPDEMANADIKQAVTKQAPARTKLQLVKAAAKHLRSVQRQPERIRKYFEHGPVRYAA
jgi:transposase